jgi:hypothetical protein
MYRDPNACSSNILIRVTQDLLMHHSLDQYIEEMQKAVREFVQTDPEVRILINEMVRTAFQQVDLLKLVTETIRQGVLEASKDNKAAGSATDPAKEDQP